MSFPILRIRCCCLRAEPTRSILLAALLLSPAAALADWRISPSVGAAYEYDDNPSLYSVQAVDESAHGALLNADIDFTHRTQISELTLTPAVYVRRYNLDELDSNDYFFNMNYDHRGQRSRFRFRGQYADESIRTAERSDVNFDVQNPDDIPNDASGRVLATAKRQRFMVAPEWSYNVGQRTFVRLGANYRDVSYGDQIVTTLTDYSAYSVDAAFGFQKSQIDSLALVGYYRDNSYSSDASFSGYGAGIEYARNLSEKTRFRARLGVDKSDSATSANQSNVVGEISITRQLETTQLIAAYDRAVVGDGSGVMSARDSVNFYVNHYLSQKVSLGAGVSAYRTDSLSSQTVNFNNVDYAQLRALLTWKVTRTWRIDFDYRYNYLKRNDLGTDANSNQIDIWLRYSPIL